MANSSASPSPKPPPSSMRTSPRPAYPTVAVTLSRAFAGLSVSPSSSSTSRSRSPSPFTTPTTSPLTSPFSYPASPAGWAPFTASAPPSAPLPRLPVSFLAPATQAPLTALPPLPPRPQIHGDPVSRGFPAASPSYGSVSVRCASPETLDDRAGSISKDNNSVRSLKEPSMEGARISSETHRAVPPNSPASISTRRASASTIGSGHSSPSASLFRRATPRPFRKASPLPKTIVRSLTRRDSKKEEKTIEERNHQYMKDKNGRRISPEILPQIELFERLTKEKEEKWARKLSERLSDDLFGSSKSSKTSKGRTREKPKKGEERIGRVEEEATKAETQAKVKEKTDGEENEVRSPLSPPPRPAREDDMGMDIVREVQSFMVNTLPTVPPQRALPARPAAPPAAQAPPATGLGLTPLVMAESMRRSSADAAAAAAPVVGDSLAADGGRPKTPTQRRPALQPVSPNRRKNALHRWPLLHTLETGLPLSARLSAIPEISPLEIEVSPEGLIRSRQGSTTLKLRSGSVVTISPPLEVNAWVRCVYLPGPIQTQPLGPSMTTKLWKGSIASLDAFQDGVEVPEDQSNGSMTPRRSSDDAVVDEVIDFFEDFGLGIINEEDMRPTTGIMTGTQNRKRKADSKALWVAKKRSDLTLEINANLAEMERPSSIQATPLTMYIPQMA